MKTKDSLLLTVIIPAYNQERSYLEECITSLRAQKESSVSYEIILVDDGSSPEEASFMDSLCAADPRCRCIHKPNGGVSSARNAGLKEASGEWVLFIDSDDWVSDQMLSALTPHMADENDLILFDLCTVKEESGTRIRILPEGTESPLSDENLRQLRLHILSGGFRGAAMVSGVQTVWNKVFRRSKLPDREEVFCEKLQVAEDLTFLVEFLDTVSGNAVYLDLPLYFRRVHGGSLMNSYNSYIRENDKVFVSRLQEMTASDPDAATTQDALMTRYIHCIMGILSYDILNPDNPAGFRKRLKDLKSLVRSEPYRTAIRSCNFSYFSKQVKQYVMLFRLHLEIVLLLEKKLTKQI